jgi:hypothetical protein
MRLGVSVVAVALMATGVARAEAPAVHALRVTEPIRVDGLLDEPAWAHAQVASGFRQREPKEGEPATEATEVRVLYDADTLYVGVRACDREPEKVIARILQRDRIIASGMNVEATFAGDDAVAIILDPFHDQRNAFVFATNPNGAEFDALIYDERTGYNVDWRGVWRVAARRTKDGWWAEFAIPFRTLRYPEGDGSAPWGFNVERLIRRKNEDTLWSAWARGAEGGLNRVSRAGHLLGLSGLPRPSLNLEVKPYGLAGVTQDRQADGSLPRESETSLGLDAKWQMTPGVVLDATVHPDYSQVESDDQIVNLTRFDVYRPEKREFFLENVGVFEFGTRGGYEPPPFLMFFSRQIGIAPEGPVPVMGGLRLSGRTGRQTIGFLGMLTNPAFGEPRTGFGVARWKRDVGASGYVGAMVTDRRTSSAGETDAGVDFSLWPTGRLNVQGFAAYTSPVGDRRADEAYRLAAEYVSARLYARAQHLVVGPDAQTGMGFVTRTDIRRDGGFFMWTFRPSGLRRIDTFAGGDWITRTNGEKQDGYGYYGVAFEREAGDRLTLQALNGITYLDGRFDLAGIIPVPPGRYTQRDLTMSLATSQNRPIFLFLSGTLSHQWDGEVDTLATSLSVAGGAHFSAGPAWTVSRAELPGGAFTAHVAGLRLGWAFSTRLVASAYVQYNSLEEKWVTNLRLNFVHRPGSDIFLVFNDDRGEAGMPGLVVSRGLAVKGTWLIRF